LKDERSIQQGALESWIESSTTHEFVDTFVEGFAFDLLAKSELTIVVFGLIELLPHVGTVSNQFTVSLVDLSNNTANTHAWDSSLTTLSSNRFLASFPLLSSSFCIVCRFRIKSER
jgi:hypothetical protein